jgi:hypothetical protein
MNTPFTRHSILAGGFVVGLCVNLTVSGQEPAPEKTPSAVVAAMTKLAEGTRVEIVDPATKQTRQARWSATPLVRYGDETRFIQDSTLWCWMDGPLPVAFQKIEINNWVANYPQWTFCFSSMSSAPLSIQWPDRRDPFRPDAVKFLRIEDGPVPAKDKRTRGLQMREMSRDFLVVSHNGNKASELRLLPRPLLEYESPKHRIVAGAVFAQAEGTNPDCLIAIQLVQSDGGKIEWVFAPVRMTSHGLMLKFKDRELWSDLNQPKAGDCDTWCYFFTPRDRNLK